jgi:WD40 repeat protein
MVTASEDHTARVWDATTGKPVTAPLKHQGAVTAAAFSADGRRVITVSKDKTARVWTLSINKDSLDDWQRLARCSPFALSNGVLIANPNPLSVCTAIVGGSAPR